MPRIHSIRQPHKTTGSRPVLDACCAVLARARREDAARWLHVSLDTVDRLRTSPTDARWTFARIKDLERFEEVTLGTETIRSALIAGEMVRRVHATDAVTSVSNDINQLADLIRRENEYLAGGAKDARKGADLAVALELHSLRQLMVAAALRARCEVTP